MVKSLPANGALMQQAVEANPQGEPHLHQVRKEALLHFLAAGTTHSPKAGEVGDLGRPWIAWSNKETHPLSLATSQSYRLAASEISTLHRSRNSQYYPYFNHASISSFLIILITPSYHTLMVLYHSMATTVASNRQITSKFFVVTLCSILITSSAAFQTHDLWGRQASYASSVAASPMPTASPVPTVTSSTGDLQTLSYPPIKMSMAPSTSTALPATYTAGTASPIRGAPSLPSANLNVALYPALDRIPPLDSALVKEWMSKIDWSKAPSNSPTGLGGCVNSTNADAVANSGKDQNCWWTCGGCTRSTDIVSCPDKATWGASFDDGPSPDTPTLLNYLDQQKLKTTFFVVGSRVLSRPAMLQYEYQTGHQISVHTWSHPYLTTLSNAEIVAELGWSKKVIKDVLGVTPNTMRPPYGDIDDRVRFIAMQMGLTPIIWTTAPSGQTFDTQDWKISTGIVTPAQVLKNFQSIIAGAPDLPTGFIVLAHDLYPQSVALAVEFVLPAAIAAGNLTIEPIITCLGKPLSEGYIETASSTNSTTTNSTSSKQETSRTAAAGAASKAISAASTISSSPRSSAHGVCPPIYPYLFCTFIAVVSVTAIALLWAQPI
ncbi:hypothetical protein PCANC_18805 [Puccinia coronata f. sp. avenae]|uniref:chitin deacetylase n=1 Tax=Puccinia coronata f. sp. avenae TaxID=200324 RepID=A0A2N5SG47_9BASI|nr:hypothetical protein PCANC_18805 [Puccinia coronata f. sp. avenae]